jgi:phage-related protein
MEADLVALKRIYAAFYATRQGKMPVREWLLELSSEDRRTIGNDIATDEYRWPIGMPTCRSMGAGLWEVRSNISDGRIARVLFGMCDSNMILWHGFIKKTQKTPTAELEIARKRWKEVMR